MSLNALWNYAGDLAWHATPCPFCNHRNDLQKVKMRRNKAPNTFDLPSLDGKDIEWQCENCKGWIGERDES